MLSDRRLTFCLSFSLMIGFFSLVVAQDTMPFEIQGHRGCRGYYPENTIPACLAALKMGITTIEIDVVISRDSQVIVSHEPYFHHLISTHPAGIEITRENEKTFNLFHMSVAEIQSFDVGIKKHPLFPLQKPMAAVKPTLDQLVEAVNQLIQKEALPSVKYNIELKRVPSNDQRTHPDPQTFAQLVYQTAKKTGILPVSNFQSFDQETVQLLRKIDKNLSLAYLVDNSQSLEMHLASLGFTPAIFSPQYKGVTSALVAECHDRKMKIIPWTVNDASDIKSMIEMGVDGIISDYPDRVYNEYQSFLKKK